MPLLLGLLGSIVYCGYNFELTCLQIWTLDFVIVSFDLIENRFSFFNGFLISRCVLIGFSNIKKPSIPHIVSVVISRFRGSIKILISNINYLDFSDRLLKIYWFIYIVISWIITKIVLLLDDYGLHSVGGLINITFRYDKNRHLAKVFDILS